MWRLCASVIGVHLGFFIAMASFSSSFCMLTVFLSSLCVCFLYVCWLTTEPDAVITLIGFKVVRTQDTERERERGKGIEGKGEREIQRRLVDQAACCSDLYFSSSSSSSSTASL